MSDEHRTLREVTGLVASSKVSDGHYIEEFRVQSYTVDVPDADGYSKLSTRDLAHTLTLPELAQIIDMTIRLPNYVIRRDFPGVAHLFTPADDVDPQPNVV